MKKFLFIIFILFLATSVNAQSKADKEIDFAFQNAKKGIYYALSNIPESKSRFSRELIEKNKLLAKVKLHKEINGVKIESTGYYQSDKVSIKIYKSFDSLVKEGYIKNPEEE